MVSDRQKLMSSSKVKAEGPRQPKCTRCRHHGLVVPQKGHARKCPYVQCRCWKCQLITERTRINALQRRLHRDTEDHCGATGEQPHTDHTKAPKPGLVRPRPIRGSAPWAQGPEEAGAEVARPVSDSPAAEARDQTPENTPCDPPPPSPNPLYWGDFSPAPLPLLHIPVPSFPHCSNFLVNMPWSPVPPGLYEGRLSPLMVSPYAPAPLYHPHPYPEPESGPGPGPGDSRAVLRPPAPPEFHHQGALDRHLHPPKQEDSEPDHHHI